MVRILETLLSLARGGRGDTLVSAVDLTALAGRRAEAWQEVAGQRGISVVAPRGEPVMTVTDRTIVESALDAVIDNAVKYSTPDSVVVVGAQRDEKACRLTVRDQGPGLTDEQAAAATDRFWRSDDRGDTPGSGLGLAIATDLLASLGAELLVESPESGGLLVTLLLPDGVHP